MAHDDDSAERQAPDQDDPSLEGDAPPRPWAKQPGADAIRAPLRIPTLAELERMLVIMALVDQVTNEDAPRPLLN